MMQHAIPLVPNISDNKAQLEIFAFCRETTTSNLPQDSPFLVSLLLEKDGYYESVQQTDRKAKRVASMMEIQSFLVEYNFAVRQSIRFVITKRNREGYKERVGEICSSITTLLNSKDYTAIFDIPGDNITNKGSKRQLVVKTERLAAAATFARMTMQVTEIKLPKKLFGKTSANLSFQLSRREYNSAFTPVFESEVRNTETACWRQVEICTAELCSNKYNQLIKLQVFNNTPDSKPTEIGEAYFKIDDLLKGKGLDYNINILSPKSGKTRGKIAIYNFQLIDRPQFLDYLQAGLQLNLLLGIDYTISNGDPNSPDSLHSRKVEGMNEYEKTITGIFDILLGYNKYKKVRMYGFGGIPNSAEKGSSINHCFPLVGGSKRFYATGLDEVLQIYRDSLNHVELASPSYLEPIINRAKSIAQTIKETESNEYTVMVILTDGKCHDMQDTIKALLQGTEVPLSIIIIGIGNGDFSKMEILDGERGLLDQNRKHKGNFVKFQKYKENESLTEQILQRIPGQVIQYMLEQRLYPKHIQRVAVHNEGKKEEEEEERAVTSLTDVNDEDDCGDDKNKSIAAFSSQQVMMNSAFFKSFDLTKKTINSGSFCLDDLSSDYKMKSFSHYHKSSGFFKANEYLKKEADITSMNSRRPTANTDNDAP